MQERGHKVPALASKPELPDYLQVVLAIHNDLTTDGHIRFTDFCAWCDRFGVGDEQLGYLWEVLRTAHNMVHEWKQKPAESSPTNSGKTTGR
jgi:hypothetical protein